LDNPHRVRDTVDGKIREKYIQLETPYDHISKVDKIQKINDQFVVGTWKLDTINPIWEVYELKFKKNHDFFKYDSVTILDKTKDKEIRAESILNGKWKIQNDTLYTSITGCVTCENNSWKKHVGGWSSYVILQNKIYRTTAEDKTIFTTRRYKKLKNKLK
jgi:hypothetical protein